MAQFKKESPQDVAFRKEMEAKESALGAAFGANLPEGTDFHYMKTKSWFNGSLADFQGRLKALLLQHPDADVAARYDLEDEEEAVSWLIEAMDACLERVDKAVDVGNNIIQEREKITFQGSQPEGAESGVASQVRGKKLTKRGKKQDLWLLNQAAAGDSLRPQLEFADLIDNSNQCFQGLLGHWREYMEAGEDAPEHVKPLIGRLNLELPEGEPPHPLSDIIDSLEYPQHVLQAPKPQRYKGLANAPVTYVETPEQLQEMASQLSKATELAVDLEHHSFRTFQGITCLMQISDRHSDFLVDVIKLRRLTGPILAPIFANPEVVKVLHGSDWDVQWLQRDFGIYIANLFDTGQAARVLQLCSCGLAYLLHRYCGVKADKKYQLADWRVRPLTPEMQLYARMDTHYLLYMYDCLKVELHSSGDSVPPALQVIIPEGRPTGALGTVLERSRQISLTRYNKPLFREDGYKEFLNHPKDPILLTRRQELVYAALYKWRDEAARERDESHDYVLARRQMLSIAKQLPASSRELQDALKGYKIPSLAEALGSTILEVVRLALLETSHEVDLKMDTAENSAAEPAAPRVSFWQGPQLHAGLQPRQPGNETAADSSTTLAQAPSENAARMEATDTSPEAQKSRSKDQQMPLGSTALQRGDAAATDAQKTQAQEAEHAMEVVGNGGSKTNPFASGAKRSAMASTFGAKKQPGKASAFASVFGNPKKLENTGVQDSAAANEIRANFAVAFPSVPETPALELTKANAAPGELDGPKPITGEDVRAVADHLRAEQPGGSPPALQSEQPLLLQEDFMPLSLTERRKRSRDDQRAAAAAEDDDEEAEGDESEEEESDQDSQDEAINRVLKKAGLESGSEEEGELPREPESSPERKRKKRITAPSPKGGFKPGSRYYKRAWPTDSSQQSASDRFGKVLPPQSPQGPTADAPEPEKAAEGSEGPGLQAFDFSAARAEAPGLDVLSGSQGQPNAGRHAGRQNRGRGGRGNRGRGRPHETSFNMYNLDESKFTKGGKRSAVMPRSGNKSHTFR